VSTYGKGDTKKPEACLTLARAPRKRVSREALYHVGLSCRRLGHSWAPDEGACGGMMMVGMSCIRMWLLVPDEANKRRSRVHAFVWPGQLGGVLASLSPLSSPLFLPHRSWSLRLPAVFVLTQLKEWAGL
jgi:hypothetical protein